MSATASAPRPTALSRLPRLPSRPPGWLWAASAAFQVACTAALTSFTYFFVDDFLFLREAQTIPFGSAYLRLPLFVHFSPVSRFLDKVLVTVAPGSFALTRVVELAMYATAIVCVALVIVEILGNCWRAFALALAFGQSLFLFRLLIWWTATANILPCTIFTALAIFGYLRWRRTRSSRWLLLSLVSVFGAALDYETGMLAPAYIGIIALFVLSDGLGPRRWWALLWEERAAWIGYGLVEALVVANYLHRYYHSTTHPPLGSILRFVWTALPRGFVPALAGIAYPQSALGNDVAVVVAVDLVAVAAVALLVYLRPRAWRCVLAFGLVFLITMLPLALNDVGVGPHPPLLLLDYEQELQLMFFVLCAFALRGGGPVRRLRYGRAIAGAAAVGAYIALYLTSAHALERSSWPPRQAHAFVTTLSRSLHAVQQRTGRKPVLIDQNVTPGLMPHGFAPYDRLDEFLPVVGLNPDYDRATGTAYLATADGHLVTARFRPLAAAGARCAAGPRTSLVRFQLPHAVALAAQTGLTPFALRVAVRMPQAARVAVSLIDGGRLIADDDFPAEWSTGVGDYFVPLTVATTVDGVALALPAHACVEQLALGTFTVHG